MSYYQKYRPSKVVELDLKSVRDSLAASLKSGVLPHAYLFVGPRGSGKTSAARIMAAAVNCEKNEKKVAEPCAKCDICLDIRGGKAVDVMEMDAASHRGIDDIRDLRDKIKLAPSRLRKKVYIIDEVHMLTKEAFNALLKILEEPPKHVMFFLCTTEEHKVPETIASRCTRVGFQKANEEEVLRSLNKAIKGEKIEIGKEAVNFLAKSVDGSFREGHKLLEQLVSNFKNIGVEEVRGLLGMIGKDRVEDLLDAVEEGETGRVGEMMMEMEDKGLDAINLLRQLLESSRERLREAGKGKGEVKVWADLSEELIKAAESLRFSPLPFLPIELALMEVGLERKEDNDGGDTGKKKAVKTEVKKEKEIREIEKIEEKVDQVVEEAKKAVNGAVKASLGQIEEEWEQLLSNLSPKYRSIAGLLRSARPKQMEGRYLTVEVFYKFHKDQLEQESKRKVVEEVANKLWGPVALKCVLGEKPGLVVETVAVSEVENKAEEEIVKAAEDIFG